MKNNSGFSLIEILIVLVILSISITFATLALGDFGQSRRIRTSSEQFVHFIKLLQQQSLIESSTLGLKINHLDYQALRYRAASGWQRINKPQFFNQQHFSQGTYISASTTLISIQSTGEITPFVLKIGTSPQHILQIIKSNGNGSITIEQSS